MSSDVDVALMNARIIHGPSVHVRPLSLLPLSALLGAGVYSELDSESPNQSSDHPPAPEPGGFFILVSAPENEAWVARGNASKVPAAAFKRIDENRSIGIPYSLLFQAPVAKWLTRRSAKPVFAGSKPARCSKSLPGNEKGPQPQSMRSRPF